LNAGGWSFELTEISAGVEAVVGGAAEEAFKTTPLTFLDVFNSGSLWTAYKIQCNTRQWTHTHCILCKISGKINACINPKMKQNTSSPLIFLLVVFTIIIYK